MKGMRDVNRASMIFGLWAAALLGGAPTGLCAAQNDTSLGAQAAPFLTWPVDARTAALGSAGVASVNDVDAPGINPAGLAEAKGVQLDLNQDFLYLGTNLESASASWSPMRKAALGVTATYLSAGTVDRSIIDPSGAIQTTGSFNPYYYVAGLSYAQETLAGLDVGATLKLVGDSIDTWDSQACAVDLGAQAATPVHGLRFGASLLNLGTTLGGANLPLTGRVGGTYKMPFFGHRNSLALSVDAQIPTAAAGQTTLCGGLELHYGRFLSLRGGYESGDYGGVTGLTNITAGAGFGMNWWQVDYAWIPEGDLGDAQQFSLSAKF